MEKGISKIEIKHGEVKRTGVSFEEKIEWIKRWPTIRAQVTSNAEACAVLSTMGQNRDPRTILSHMQRLLPLVNTKAISALVELIDDCERRMPIKEAIQQIREKFPIEEMAPEIANVADTAIKELPPLGDVLKAFGSILAGGFPFDPTRLKK
jgi:carbamoylphosphate synthase large subunit